MTVGRRRTIRALAIWVAVPAVVLAWGAYGLRESPMAVVIDLPDVGVRLSIAALLASGLGLRLLRGRQPARVSRGAAVAVLGAAAIVLALLVRFRLSFEAEDARFAHDGIELAGTLFTPPGEGPHPAVVLIQGSGPESRKEYAFYARFLARRGIAGLAYDKRGVGESTGALYEADYADYAADVLAGVRMLAGRPDIDPDGIGLVGFSEAEWVAPIAAAGCDTVTFLAVVGASGGSPAQQVAAEMAMRLRARGHGEAVVERALALNERVYAYQRTGEGAEGLAGALAEARAEDWFDDAADLPEEVHPPEDYAWWRSVMDFDPAPVWARVGVPVLLLKGGLDDRSPPESMRRRITTALRRGGNEDVRVEIYPQADHMLLEWPLGNGTPPPTFAQGYPDILVSWIRQVVDDVAVGGTSRSTGTTRPGRRLPGDRGRECSTPVAREGAKHGGPARGRSMLHTTRAAEAPCTVHRRQAGRCCTPPFAPASMRP